jgi:hypothetical protein
MLCKRTAAASASPGVTSETEGGEGDEPLACGAGDEPLAGGTGDERVGVRLPPCRLPGGVPGARREAACPFEPTGPVRD